MGREKLNTFCHTFAIVLPSQFANGNCHKLDNGSTLTYERTNERTNALPTSDRKLRFHNAHEPKMSTGLINMWIMVEWSTC